MSHFSKLAQQILTTNDPQALAQMTHAVCDPSNLELLLNEIPHLNDLHFIFTEILTKSIFNGDFCPINETKSDDNHSRQISNQKTKVYEIILPRVFHNICSGILHKEYIVKSALNLLSACLKDLTDSNKNQGAFISLMQQCLFLGWKHNPAFTNPQKDDLCFLPPSAIILNHFACNKGAINAFNHSAKIMNELVDYATMSSLYKNYYDFRRYIYMFRNLYIPIILNISTEYHKLLHQEWQKDRFNLEMIEALTVSSALVEKVISFPFSLTMQDYDAGQQIKDSAVGVNTDVYYPPCYRNVLCDRAYIEMLFEFFFFVINQLDSITQLGDTVYSLLKICGRICSASSYTFTSDDERKIYRLYCTQMVVHLLSNFKFFDSFYISSLSDIFLKVLSIYTISDIDDKREALYRGFMLFTEALVQNCDIKLEDGKRNQFCRAFQLIVALINQVKDSAFATEIKTKAQQILNKAFMKFCNWEYTQKIMNDFGKNQKSQIECFQELFEHVPIIFSYGLEDNLKSLMNLNVETFTESQQIIWLHLCSVLLPSHLANRTQTQIILKYFKVAQQGNTLASLHYIHVLITQVLHEMQNGIPSTCLWTHIRDIEKVDFTQFVLYVLRTCKKNFEQTNTQIIDYALDVFKSIYMQLKKHSLSQSQSVEDKFNPFYSEVKQLIGNLDNTVFANPKFFKRRVKLFSVISTIWISSENYKYLSQIYNLASSPIKQQLQTCSTQDPSIDPATLLKYMHDMRGIIEPIEDSDCFKIIVELAIEDLSVVLPIMFRSKATVKALFEDEMFIKAFCKMTLQFVTDYGRRITHHVQTEVPFLIHDLFKPYLLELVNYDFPKCTVKIWQKFSCLHPLQPLLPIIPAFKQKCPQQFGSLIKQYFDNIHRVELGQLESMYPFIEDRVEFVCQWWEEIVRRKLNPSYSLVEVVDSRIAGTKRQKEELAKLVFLVGSYDAKYWNLNGCSDERTFVKWFLEFYK